MARDHSSQFENNYFTEVCSGSEAGSYLRLIDFANLEERAGAGVAPLRINPNLSRRLQRPPAPV